MTHARLRRQQFEGEFASLAARGRRARGLDAVTVQVQRSWRFALKVSGKIQKVRVKVSRKKKKTRTEGRGDVDVDVKVEAGVFEKAESTLPFLGPVAELHEVTDAVGRCHRRRRQQNVLGANLQPNILPGQ